MPPLVHTSLRQMTFLAAGLSLLQILLFTLARGVVLDEHVNDLLHVGDGAARIALGQRPHVDFKSPIGALYFGVAPWLAPGTTDIARITKATALIWSLGLGGVYLWLWWSRIRTPVALLILPAILLVGLGPRVIGASAETLSWAVPYNRWGMLGLALAMLFALPTKSVTRSTTILDAVAMAVLCLALFFLKITFGLAAASALGVAALAYRGLRPAVIATAIVGASVLFAIELASSIVTAYARDVADVVMSPLRSTRSVGRLLATMIEYGNNLMLVLLLGVATALAPISLRDKLVIGAMTMIAVASAKQNHGHYALPLIGPLALLLAQARYAPWSDPRLPAALLGGGLLYFGAMLANQQWALLTQIRASFKPRPAAFITPSTPSAIRAQQVLDGVRPRDLPGITYNCIAKPSAGAPPRNWLAATCRPTPHEYLETLRHAASLMDRLGVSPQARVHTLDQINPLWWISGRRPPPGVELWEFDLDARKNLAHISAFADYVFVPAYSIEPSVGAELKARWQPHLERQATLLETDTLWQVWKVR
jgi:hypothetical protein